MCRTAASAVSPRNASAHSISRPLMCRPGATELRVVTRLRLKLVTIGSDVDRIPMSNPSHYLADSGSRDHNRDAFEGVDVVALAQRATCTITLAPSTPRVSVWWSRYPIQARCPAAASSPKVRPRRSLDTPSQLGARGDDQAVGADEAPGRNGLPGRQVDRGVLFGTEVEPLSEPSVSSGAGAAASTDTRDCTERPWRRRR